jgi:hypothetical protein
MEIPAQSIFLLAWYSFNEAMTFRSWKLLASLPTVTIANRFNEAMTFRSWKSCLLKHLSHKGQNPFSRAAMRFHLTSSLTKRNNKTNSTISPANFKLASGHRCFVTTSPLADQNCITYSSCHKRRIVPNLARQAPSHQPCLNLQHPTITDSIVK